MGRGITASLVPYVVASLTGTRHAPIQIGIIVTSDRLVALQRFVEVNPTTQYDNGPIVRMGCPAESRKTILAAPSLSTWSRSLGLPS